MIEQVLNVDRLTGGYSVRHPVLHQLSFSIYKGEIVGLIGLNGAGKSTTIKHILGLLRPVEGEIRLNGKLRNEEKKVYQSNLAYIPETPLLYDELTVMEHLDFTARAYGLPKEVFMARANRLLKEFDMERMANWLPKSFSKGMKQKLMVMCAFLIEPSLYIVDEPFVGLDPKAIRSLLQHLVSSSEKGTSVLLSTHILSTAQMYCDRFLILHHGKLVIDGTLAEMQGKLNMNNATLDEIFSRLTGDTQND